MPRDCIRLNNIVLFSHLGVSAAEREVGQRIRLDVELGLDLTPASRSDALVDTISYEAVYRTIERVVESSRHRLLETVAGDLMDQIFEEFAVDSIRLRVRKLNVPFSGSVASAEIELVRDR